MSTGPEPIEAEERFREIRQRIGENGRERAALALELQKLLARKAVLIDEAKQLRSEGLRADARDADREAADIGQDILRMQANLTKMNELARRYNTRLVEAQSASKTPEGEKRRLTCLYAVADAAFDVLYAVGDDEELMDRLEEVVTALRAECPDWRARNPA